jgi:hypothetical protein
MKTRVSTLALAALMLTTGMAVAQEKQQMPGQQERGGGRAEPGNRGGETRSNEGGSRGQSGRENAAPRQERSGGSAARGQSPGSEGAGRQSQDAPAMKEPRRTTQARPGDRAKQNADHAQNDNARTRAEPNKAAPKTGEAQKSEPKSAPKTGETQKAEPKSRTATEPPRKQDTNRSSQGAGTGDTGRATTQNRDNAAPSRGGSTNAPGARTDRRVEFSVEQRDRVRNVFREKRPARVTNVRVDINVGRRVPRNVTLHAIPAAVLAIVPEYRSYRYVYVEDRYVIVDPVTYEIVYIIDDNAAPRGNAPRAASLTLSVSERQILLSSIEFGRARADFSFRFGLGAQVPDQIALYDFPPDVLQRLPKLASYRYVIVENNVLIIDPRSRDIVVVIEA